MRAVICKWFPGYRFADLDNMSFERVIELYSGAEWLAEQEAKAVESSKGKKGRR